GAKIPGATFLAGVEIEPSGLRLRLPASLTLSPAVMADTRTAVSLAYSGKESPRAVLRARGAALAAGTHSILLTHFSGGLVAGLAQKVLELGNQGNEGPFAEAMAKVIALEGTFARNVIDHLQNDPTFQQKLDSGLVSNMDDVRAVLDAMFGIERSQDIIGDSA